MARKSSSRKFTVGDLRERLERNKSLSEANPTIRTALTALNAAPVSPASAFLPPGGHMVAKTPSKGKKRGVMNDAETEFSKFLEHKRLDGEIFSWEYEAVRLRYGDIAYTPDFFVIEKVTQLPGHQPMVSIVFYEVKGGWKWTKDILRFKAIRTHFELFRFELWERKDREWRQLI